MPIYCIFKNYENGGAGEFVRADRWSPPSRDPDTEVLIELQDDAEWPGKTGERWDGATGTRAPTDAELEARAAKVERQALDNALADISVNPVMLRIVWDLIEQVRVLGGVSNLPALSGIDTLPAFRRAIVRHYARRENPPQTFDPQ